MIRYMIDTLNPTLDPFEIDILKENKRGYETESAYFSRSIFRAYKTERDALCACVRIFEKEREKLRQQTELVLKKIQKLNAKESEQNDR